MWEFIKVILSLYLYVIGLALLMVGAIVFLKWVDRRWGDRLDSLHEHEPDSPEDGQGPSEAPSDPDTRPREGD